MKTARLADMTKGWFIGDFSPSLHRTRALEAAVKHYCAGDREAAHYHKVATEYTVIVSGSVEMNGNRYSAGEVVVVEPGETTDFHAVTDAVTAVIKLPGAPNDKFLA